MTWKPYIILQDGMYIHGRTERMDKGDAICASVKSGGEGGLQMTKKYAKFTHHVNLKRSSPDLLEVNIPRYSCISSANSGSGHHGCCTQHI